MNIIVLLERLFNVTTYTYSNVHRSRRNKSLITMKRGHTQEDVTKMDQIQCYIYINHDESNGPKSALSFASFRGLLDGIDFWLKRNDK